MRIQALLATFISTTVVVGGATACQADEQKETISPQRVYEAMLEDNDTVLAFFDHDVIVRIDGGLYSCFFRKQITGHTMTRKIEHCSAVQLGASSN
jgi:hypothetical protein